MRQAEYIHTNKVLYTPFYLSGVTPKDKKYSVFVRSKQGNKKLIHFGARKYQHFRDSVSNRYLHLNHLDEERKERYQKRHKGIRLKSGKRAIDDRNQPAYYSFKYLWT